MDVSRIEQLLVGLQEAVVSNNNNELQLRLNSQEKKIQELQDQMNKLLEQVNQQSNKTCCHQELQQKEDSLMKEKSQEMKSTDSKAMENESVDLLKNTSSISELLDYFLFGSQEEQKLFESLCHKWIINNFNEMETNKFYFSDICFHQENNFKSQLKLKHLPNGMVNFSFCFKDKDEERKEMKSKQPPVVTIIFKDCSGRRNKKHVLNYEHYVVTETNPFYSSDNWMQVTKDKLEELASPYVTSMEVLFLMLPPTVFANLHSTDGTLTDKIPYFEEKLKMEHMFSYGHWSPPFMTHPNGHRVIVKFYLKRNANDNQLELEASIYFLPCGEFPYKLHVTITLIHPSNINQKNITIQQQLTSDGGNIITGNIHEIERRGLISNNSLNYQVHIR